MNTSDYEIPITAEEYYRITADTPIPVSIFGGQLSVRIC